MKNFLSVILLIILAISLYFNFKEDNMPCSYLNNPKTSPKENNTKDSVKPKDINVADTNITYKPLNTESKSSKESINQIYKEKAKNKFLALDKLKDSYKNEIRNDAWATPTENAILNVLTNESFFSKYFAEAPECRSNSCIFSFQVNEETKMLAKKSFFKLAAKMHKNPILSQLQISRKLDKETGVYNVFLVKKSVLEKTIQM